MKDGLPMTMDEAFWPDDGLPFDKQHYQLQRGRWRCRDPFGDWWWMPTCWRPGMSIEGFVWR